MAYLSIENVALKGVSVCVPKKIEENISLEVYADKEEAVKFINSSKIEERRIADDNIITSDLCFEAAEKLITELGWEKSEIDCLIFVSYTFDYILPSTSCILQNRLGLSQDCYTLDIRYGCTGWVYGASVIANLLSNGFMKKGLLLTGEVASKVSGKFDKTTYPLFGDAGSATAFEHDVNSKHFFGHFGTDGSGYDAIIIPDGGLRNPITIDSFKEIEIETGIKRNRIQQQINGMDVFAFGISKAPFTISSLMEKFNLSNDDIDYYLIHQANHFMIERIRKRLKISEEKVPYSLSKFGNTASASIPVTMVTQLKNQLINRNLKLIACGFGVGLSWGAVCFETENIICCDLIEL